MKMLLHFTVFLLTTVGAIAAEGPRNPFWPRGYEGERTPISAEVRKKKPKPEPAPKQAAAQTKVDPKVAAARAAEEKEKAAKAAAKAAEEKAAAEKAAREKAEREAAERAEAERKRVVTAEDWRKAMKSLRIGNPAVFKSEDGTTRSTISINGNIYGDGDLMSVTHEGIRFTWRVRGLSGGEKLRLDRIKARRVK